MVHERLPEAPVERGLELPDGWDVQTNGVFSEDYSVEGGDSAAMVTPTPVLIESRQKEIGDGSEKIRLVFFRDGRWQDALVPREMIAVPSKITKLNQYGIMVTGGPMAKLLVMFFSDLEKTNMERIPLRWCSQTMGWHRNKWTEGFLLGEHWIGETRGRVLFRSDNPGSQELALGIVASGSLDKWRHGIELASAYPFPMAAVYGAFASPLLHILERPNFGIDLSGETSRGKTTAIRLAASVFGPPDPSRRGSMLGTWDLTPTGLERVAGVRGDLPLLIDDSMQANSTNQVRRIVYNVCSGRGRIRGSSGGLQVTPAFRTVFVTTGEHPLTGLVNEGGGHARIVELWGQPFGDGNQQELVHELTGIVSKNYGEAGMKFITFLHNERSRWPEFCETFEAARAAYLGEAKGNPVLVRLGEHVAVLKVAAQLVHETLALPWDWRVPMTRLWDYLVSQADDTQRSARALEDFHAWAVVNQRRFDDGHPSHQFGEASRVGRWVRNADGQTVCIAILPPALKRILRQLRYPQADGIIRSWHDRGWLLTDGDRQTRRCKTVKIAGEPVKCVAISGQAIVEVTGNCGGYPAGG